MSPRPFSRRFGRSFIAVCGLWIALTILSLLPSAQGDIQLPTRSHSRGERLLRRQDGPAVALPQDTAVEQGGRVEIILRGAGQGGRMLDFTVRSRPKHGTLSAEPVQIAHNVASIVYFHSPDDEASDDDFTFSVQAAGTPLSAPETVRVRVLPSEPILEASPPELDFGAVKAGETARAEFTLSNRGGSPATGRVSPPVPWMVDGSAEYNLPRGASQTFRLVFNPTGEEVFTEEMHFRYETKGVRLVGTGLADPSQAAAMTERLAAAKAAQQQQEAAEAAATAAQQRNSLAGTATGIDVNGRNGRTAAGGVAATNLGGVSGPSGPSRQFPGNDLGGGRSPNATAAASPANTRNAGNTPGTVAGGDPSTANPDETTVILNEASVEEVRIMEVGATTVDLEWMPPVPKPASYRVEIRYLSMEENERLRIDWRPYPSIKFSAGRDKVTAHLTGLPSGGLQMMRVVAVDTAGQLALPSPMITAPMKMASPWWRFLTPLRVLVALLVICGGLVIRKRLEDRSILQEIDDSRARIRAAEAGMSSSSRGSYSIPGR